MLAGNLMFITGILVAFVSAEDNCVFRSGGHSWSYDDLAAWDDIGYCNGYVDGVAYAQSPIDIDSSVDSYDDSQCDDFDWDIQNRVGFEVKFDGHSIKVTPVERNSRRSESDSDSDDDSDDDDSDDDDEVVEYLTSADNSVARLQNLFGSESEFCLHSFHFHWGHDDTAGSEHTVDGSAYPLEVHFVHFACDHGEIVESICVGESRIGSDEDRGTLAVVGVLFEIDDDADDNEALERIFRGGDYVDDLSGSDPVVYGSGLDISDFLPDDRSFYAYLGSLTTPPCSPVVRWHVMQETIKIPSSQMEWFYSVSDHDSYRPVLDVVGQVGSC